MKLTAPPAFVPVDALALLGDQAEQHDIRIDLPSGVLIRLNAEASQIAVQNLLMAFAATLNSEGSSFIHSEVSCVVSAFIRTSAN